MTQRFVCALCRGAVPAILAVAAIGTSYRMGSKLPKSPLATA